MCIRLKTNIYTSCIKVFPVSFKFYVALNSSANKYHILRWAQTSRHMITFNCIQFEKESLSVQHLTIHFILALFCPQRHFGHLVLPINETHIGLMYWSGEKQFRCDAPVFFLKNKRPPHSLNTTAHNKLPRVFLPHTNLSITSSNSLIWRRWLENITKDLYGFS